MQPSGDFDFEKMENEDVDLVSRHMIGSFARNML